MLLSFAPWAFSAAAASGSQQPWGMVGQIGGPTQAIAVQGRYAYVGVGLRLTVLDVSDPAKPLEVSSSAPFSDFVRDIAVSGGIAYVAAGGAGLHLISVADPAKPVELGAPRLRGYAEGVAVVGNTICLADGPYGLRVIDVSKPANPVEVGSAFTRNYTFKVAMDGRYAYLAAAGAGLLIADLANPSKPVEVATLATPGYAYGVTVSGNTVYVAGGWEGVSTVDVTTKTAPSLLGQHKTDGWAFAVGLSGTQAYVAAGVSGLMVLDVSNPAQPAEIGGLAVEGGDAAGVALAGPTAFVADRSWGVEAVNVSAPANPAQVGFYGPLGYASAVVVAGKYAYVAAGTYGLRILDISDPGRPRQVGAFDTQSFAQCLAVAGKYAYVGTMTAVKNKGLIVVDISDATQPRGVGFSPTPSPVRNLALSGNIIYAVDEWGLVAIDVSDPTAPKQLSFLQLQQPAGGGPAAAGVAVADSVAYVAQESHGLLAVDVSNPAAPSLIGQLQWTNTSADDVAIAGNVAVVSGYAGLTTVDVSNPRAPVWLGSYQAPGHVVDDHLIVAGTQAFLPNGGGGLNVVDLSNPRSPSLSWGFRAPGYAKSAFVDGGYAFVANSLGGLVVLAAPQAQPAALLDTVMTTASVPFPRVRTRSKPDTPARLFATQAASSCTVTSTADHGAGTLRDCLTNASSGTVVTFDAAVFPPGHPSTIAALGSLPVLSQGNVTIDASNAGVILDGSSADARASGLNLASAGNVIRGLQIVHFPNYGVWVAGEDNVIGGSRNRGSGPLGEGNLISGNGANGINADTDAKRTTIIGNSIGTDVTGTAAIGNGHLGILVQGSPDTRVGGSSSEFRNVISGNPEGGVGVNSSAGTVIMGNYIGLDASGTRALSNGRGVAIGLGSTGTVVQGNVIVADSAESVLIDDWGSSYNTVAGNLIGTDASGRVALGAPGINVNVGSITSFNRIGGAAMAERNVIASEVLLAGSANLLLGNFIGTDISGSTVIAKHGVGVVLEDGRAFLGGTTPGERNVTVGLQASTGADYSFIGGNYIGPDLNGLSALSNASNNLQIYQASHLFVQGNVIAHNPLGGFPGEGVVVSGGVGNTLRQNLVFDNRGGGIAFNNGGNAGISPPVISSVTSTGASGTACPGCEVEIFSDSDGQGRVFEGSAIAGASGAFVFDEGNPLAGPNITATATDIDGNTSAFSTGVAAKPLPPNAPQELSVTPLTLQFAYILGGALPAPQPLRITKLGGGSLEWSANSDVPWLSAAPASSVAPSTVELSVAPQGLAAGKFNGVFTIAAAGIGSRAVAVTLTVSPPAPAITAAADGAGFQSAISPGAWVSIFGANLATTTRTWRADEIVNGVLPTKLDNVSVSIDGKPAAVYYISPTQVNVQAPDDTTSGPVTVAITNPLGTATTSAILQPVSPGLFLYDAGNRKYVAAQHGDYSIVGPAGLYAGATPARPGEAIILYATGFGQTSPPTPCGQVVSTVGQIADLAAISVTVGSKPAQVLWAGITMAGVWQLNIQIPADAPSGDAAIVAQIGGKSTQTGAFVTIRP